MSDEQNYDFALSRIDLVNCAEVSDSEPPEGGIFKSLTPLLRRIRQFCESFPEPLPDGCVDSFWEACRLVVDW